MKLSCGLAFSILLATATAPSLAKELGDWAPQLRIKEWIKGDSVDLKKGRGSSIYVIEFWATWCGPCRRGIPHLTNLQAKYEKQGVVFVGVSAEKPSVIRRFVKQQGSRMKYRVAADDSRKTYRNYMIAFRQNGIPHAFLVDRKGKLVWHGHPSGGLDRALAKLVDKQPGTGGPGRKTDTAQSRKAKDTRLSKARLLRLKYCRFVKREPIPDALRSLGARVLTFGAHDATFLSDFSEEILTNPKFRYRDYELALDAAELAYDLSKGASPEIAGSYANALIASGREEQALKIVNEAIDASEGGAVLVKLRSIRRRIRTSN